MSKSENITNQQKISRLSKRNTLTQSNKFLVKSPKPQMSKHATTIIIIIIFIIIIIAMKRCNKNW
jgi:hypothetical protein